MANGELSLFPDEFDAPRIFRDVTDANLPSGLLEEYYDEDVLCKISKYSKSRKKLSNW